jgi:hypothetical protein
MNHKLDCRYYNIALRDIMVKEIMFHDKGIKNATWDDFVNYLNEK